MSRRKLDLKYFRPDKIPRDSTIAIVSKRRTGKSTLIRNLVFDIKPSKVVAFIGSEAASTFYSKFIPDLFIYQHWDPEALQRIFAYQRAHFTGDDNDIITVIIDDFGFDTNVMKSRELRELFQNGRHLGIQVILALQFLRSVPLVNRGNFDIICVLKENNKNNQRILHEECFSVFETLADFRRVLTQTTADYGVLVQDNTSRGTTIEESVMYYRAKLDLPKFIACHQKGQKVAKRNIKTDLVSSCPSVSPQKQSPRKKKVKLDEPFVVRI